MMTGSVRAQGVENNKKNKQWTTLVYLVNIGIRNLAKVVSKVLSSPYDDSELYFLSEIGEFDQIPFFTLT